MVSASEVQETSAGTVVVGRRKRYKAKGSGLLGGVCLRGESGRRLRAQGC